MGSDDSTSRSLLIRVAANDQEAWRHLVNLYSPLLGFWCRQAGLPDDARDDVIQDVFAAVAADLKDHRKGEFGAEVSEVPQIQNPLCSLKEPDLC